jgi:methionine synthase II (cobalamin-independent)
VRIESKTAIHEALAAVTAHVPVERCLAAPSTALQHLPYHTALDKLNALTAAAHAFAGMEVPV